MKRSLASIAALAFMATGVAAFAGMPAAQTGTETPEACASGEQEISASALPEYVDAEACQAGGRPIVDGAIGATLPPPGEGVYVEALTADGAQQLEIKHLQDGTIQIDHAGEESGVGEALAGAGRDIVASRSPGECRDPAYTGAKWRVAKTFRYRINWRTTPSELSRVSAIAAIRRGGGNVARTANGCKLGDRVPARIIYEGYSAARAGVGADSRCTGNDRTSVVSFGNLGSRIFATTCTYYDFKPGFDRVTYSDVKINKADRRWTTKPRARSCKRAIDLEGVMTHERGHTFGLGHVAEKAHRDLTMSPIINGPCQASERSLGRGDVLGLGRKYR